MFRLIFIILLNSAYGVCVAQDSLLVKPSKKKNFAVKSWFAKDSLSYRIGFDVVGVGQAFFVPKIAVHINSDIAFRNKNLLVGEYTWAKREEAQQARYQSQGSIVRVGWLHNFLYKQSKEDVFGVGVRLANAWFSEQIEANIQNAIFGNEPVAFHQNLQATWLELNMELKARIAKNWVTGYCLRYQFRPFLRGEQVFTPYSIPSVGRIGKNNWGFQYVLWYRF